MNFNATNIEEIKSFYIKNGYVVIDPIISASELDELSAEVDAKMGKLQLGVASTFQMNDLALKIEPLLGHIFKPEYVRILQSVLGCEDLDLQHSKYNAKNPEGGSRVPLHQDFPFFPHTDERILAFNFHLDGSSKENGGMYVFPGEWKSPLPHDDTSKGFKEISQCFVENKEKVYFECAPGAVTLHSSFIPHGSDETQNEAKRRMLVFQMRNPLNKQVGGCLWKCNGYNPVTKSYNDPIQKWNGEIIKARRLWEPREYFE